MTADSGIIPFTNVIQSLPVDTTKTINYENLSNKVIVITGGASGFGAAWLRKWAPHNAAIIIGDINEKAGQALISEVRASSNNKNLHFLRLDVTDWNSQVNFFREAARISPHGGIDTVVANAGIADAKEGEAFENPPDYTSVKTPPAPELRTLETNLNGVMYTTTLSLAYLPRNPTSKACAIDSAPSQPRDRHLLLVSSMAGLSPLPTQSIYAASKHGVVGLFRSLRISAPLSQGVRINVLHPYFVETAILGTDGALALAGGGIAQIEDVVDAASRCVTDQSIIGRGLIIGPKADQADAGMAGMDVGMMKAGEEMAVWDSYSHDFEQSDVFTRRMIAITNLRAGRKGVAGFLGDIAWALTPAMMRRALGYT
jgi:NAD(P)-dependent dehydrogenase (short-subunit alcohol dehydrogenase family)